MVMSFSFRRSYHVKMADSRQSKVTQVKILDAHSGAFDKCISFNQLLSTGLQNNKESRRELTERMAGKNMT